jgi:hypothetical protein
MAHGNTRSHRGAISATAVLSTVCPHADVDRRRFLDTTIVVTIASTGYANSFVSPRVFRASRSEFATIFGREFKE